MKRYFVAASKTSPQICIRDVAEIAALLSANKIQEHYVAREWTGPSSQRMTENDDAPWLTIAQLLAVAYKDKPIVTVVLKDTGCATASCAITLLALSRCANFGVIGLLRRRGCTSLLI